MVLFIITRTICEDIYCIEKKKNDQVKNMPANTNINNMIKENTLHLRKTNTISETSQWIENEEDIAEIAFEQRVCELKKDPLYILNPMPSNSLRSAQKTLQQSKYAGILIFRFEHSWKCVYNKKQA